MKKMLTLIVVCCPIISCFGQKRTTNVQGSFYSIRNKDFSQLIGASTPGLSISYNSDKSAINGSFSLLKDSTKRPTWLQLVTSIGTTSTLFDLHQDPPQPDFSVALSFTRIIGNKYYYDGTFSSNFENIKGNTPLASIPTGSAGFVYTPALRAKLQDANNKLSGHDRLYTAKRINWISIRPEWGGATYTYYDKKESYTNQVSKPYYNLYSINASFNHYWYVNNEDVRWTGFPVTHFFYYNVSARYGTNNNSDALKKASINDISSTVVDTASKTTRQVIKNTTAYAGVYEHYTAFSPSFELLYSFVNIFAFDFFGSYNFITSSHAMTKDYGSIAGGLYFYTSSNGSKVNIGIYYQHSINTSPAKEIIGLKTKVPISW